MAQLVEFPTEGGETVLVEVSNPFDGIVTRGFHGAVVTERAQQSFEAAVRRVQPALQAVAYQVSGLAQPPDEIHVEFGLDLHAEAGAYVAAASATANFTVGLTWHRNESHTPTE